MRDVVELIADERCEGVGESNVRDDVRPWSGGILVFMTGIVGESVDEGRPAPPIGRKERGEGSGQSQRSTFCVVSRFGKHSSDCSLETVAPGYARVSITDNNLGLRDHHSAFPVRLDATQQNATAELGDLRSAPSRRFWTEERAQ